MSVTSSQLTKLIFRQGHLVQLSHLTKDFRISRISYHVHMLNNSRGKPECKGMTSADFKSAPLSSCS